MTRIGRAAYAQMYGPTTGDRVRLADSELIVQVEKDFAGQQYGAFKVAVAEAVIEYLRPVQEKYTEIRADEAAIEDAFATGADKAREICAPIVAEARDKMGLGRPVA